MAAKKPITIQSYADAAAALAAERHPETGMRLHKNCRLHRMGENYVVRHYYTDIVTYYPDGTFSLNCGGWPTPSTRDWIEATAPAFIRQKNKKWEILLEGYGTWQPFVNGTRYRSTDGTRSTLTVVTPAAV
jgi:hypothetical protein